MKWLFLLLLLMACASPEQKAIDQMQKAGEVTKEAVDAKDYSICNKLESLSKAKCISAVAGVNPDVSKCELIIPLGANDRNKHFFEQESDKCMRVVAYASEDATICENIKDFSAKQLCRDRFK